MASMHSAQTHVLIIPTIAHWAISSAVHVLRLVSTANSRTERLHVLLPASIMAICMYLFQSLLQFAGFPTKYTPPSNSSRIKTNSEKNSSRSVWLKKYGSLATAYSCLQLCVMLFSCTQQGSFLEDRSSRQESVSPTPWSHCPELHNLLCHLSPYTRSFAMPRTEQLYLSGGITHQRVQSSLQYGNIWL